MSSCLHVYEQVLHSVRSSRIRRVWDKRVIRSPHFHGWLAGKRVPEPTVSLRHACSCICMLLLRPTGLHMTSHCAYGSCISLKLLASFVLLLQHDNNAHGVAKRKRASKSKASSEVEKDWLEPVWGAATSKNQTPKQRQAHIPASNLILPPPQFNQSLTYPTPHQDRGCGISDKYSSEKSMQDDASILQ